MKSFKLQRSVFIVISVLLLINSCAQTGIRVEAKKPVVEQTVESDTDTLPKADEREYQRGIEAISVRDYDLAKIIFKQFIDKNPGLSGAYVNLALIEFYQEQYDQADKLSTLAIDLNPDQAYAYNLRGQIQLKRGEIHKARDSYLKAIRIYPGYTNAHYNLALLYDIFLQEIALAIEHYTIYLSLLDKEDENTKDWIEHLKSTLKNG